MSARRDHRDARHVKPVARTALTLTFLGTCGEIKIRSRRHRRRSSLLVQRGPARVMIDCGADWLGRLKRIAPTAIVLTHAHSDHAAGLAAGAPCPVYATKEAWDSIQRFPVKERLRLPARKCVAIDGVRFRAIPVEHSIRAPAVGYHVSAQGSHFFYLPDVARLPNASAVLRGIDVYIGDGATIGRPLLRKRGGALIGHASIVAQLEWCKQAAVRRAIFTHCGTPIVRGNARKLSDMLERLGRKRGLEARFACDGDRLSLPEAR